MEILYLALLSIGIFSVWQNYRKKSNSDGSEEEVRNRFVRFLLSIILLIIAIMVFVFYLYPFLSLIIMTVT
ncbi:heme/copper-type cytochrome/quinol oxidase subunit 4 [Gracilibacillus halotolerans]|uniref:Heme/copper-type cytochrome/quinol oxidase subunit 4 n=1 Tax=Gracilibacillus halotolerans TaxID=74386 RepID=A0A841RIT4_9BACI|nr:hypothetical protein [Gracilibacillus halotolerans]MBB6514140.1 heme/copper-type cytochrome/quinol oxidase subunit 4 [Gracilibacillus halotolerans]